TTLIGPDVILVHRMLKNGVVERTGIRAYTLLSEAFIGNARFGELGLGLRRHLEDYPDLGTVSGRFADLAPVVKRHRAAARCCVASAEADMEIVAELPVPRSVAWAYCLDPARRLRWQLRRPSRAGPRRAGAPASARRATATMDRIDSTTAW